MSILFTYAAPTTLTDQSLGYTYTNNVNTSLSAVTPSGIISENSPYKVAEILLVKPGVYMATVSFYFNASDNPPSNAPYVFSTMYSYISAGTYKTDIFRGGNLWRQVGGIFTTTISYSYTFQNVALQSVIVYMYNSTTTGNESVNYYGLVMRGTFQLTRIA